MQIGNVWLDPKSRASNALIKAKHKLFFHVKDCSNYYDKFGILIDGIHGFYATMNGFYTKPKDRWFYSIDEDVEHMYIRLRNIKPYGCIETKPRGFGYISQEECSTKGWRKAYKIKDSVYQQFKECLFGLNELEGDIMINYIDFKNKKISNIFSYIENDVLDLLELP